MKRFNASNIFTAFVLLVMVCAVIDGLDYPFLAAVYPLFTAVFVGVVAIILLVKNLTKGDANGGKAMIDIGTDRTVPTSVRVRKAGRAFAWVLGFYLFIWLLGFKLGALAFAIGYVAIEARARWHLILGISAGLAVVMVGFKRVLNVFWPLGLLGEWLEESYPWLF